MDKLLKYLMLLLVTTLSLTFTACGGDDDDEPTFPDSSFLYGTWHYQSNRNRESTDMTFSSDGSFDAYIVSQVTGNQYNIYKIIGKWEYKKGKISIIGKMYQGDIYLSDHNSTLEIIYDEYINKLIVKEDCKNDYIYLSGQYTKM